jgi:putative ABC transport system permease protein
MSPSLRTALSQIRFHPGRFVAVTLAVVLGVGFVAATLVFSATYRATLADRVTAPYRGADLIVTPADDGGGTPGDLVERLWAVPGVRYAEVTATEYVDYTAAESRGAIALQTFPGDARLQWFTVEQGRRPAAGNEVVVDRSTATTANLAIGQRFSVSTRAEPGRPVEVTVVGVVDTSSSSFSGARPTAFVTAALMADVIAAQGDSSAPIAVLAEKGVPDGDLRAAVEDFVGGTAVVQSADEYADEAIASLTNEVDILAIVLLGFGVIAVVAAGIVIANTFTILVAQRRRQIALTRCVGATSGQVRRDLLVEAAAIGLLGSTLGVGVGAATGWLGARLTGLADGAPVLPPVALLITAAGGVLLTVLAAVAPASAAMGVAPLVALAPVAEDGPRRRAGRRRLAVALLLTSAGVGLMTLAVLGNQVLLALGGGALSAVGILLLSPTFVPPMLRVVGVVGGMAGVSGRLAALNSRRNPGRVAATAAALMLGVGLIVTMQVGAASAQASLDRALEQQYPVDISITGAGEPVPRSVIEAVTAQPGLRAAAAVPGASARVTTASGNDPAIEGTVLGLPGDAGSVVATVPAELRDDTVLVPGHLLASELSVGEKVRITVGGRTGTFSVAAGALPALGTGGGSFILTGAALAELAPDAAPLAIWASLQRGADAEQVTSDLNRTVARAGLTLGGSAPERAATSSTLGTVVTVAVAMLAVAVVIAIVGIGNTLGLSVIERTRESALLRALGLHRRQLRLMLAIEAAMLAVIAAVVGVLAGIGYGWVGVRSAFGTAGGDSTLAIPWASLALVLTVAVGAGVLASVLPARRATMTPPTQALAAE